MLQTLEGVITSFLLSLCDFSPLFAFVICVCTLLCIIALIDCIFNYLFYIFHKGD